ncbi:MAG: galactokinase [Gemmatimonadetes bacterium]|nr:galactokinase [Gemmatimonadota bacterium]NIO32905.1 galactokinase [Gemmatimonadota bacterium]
MSTTEPAGEVTPLELARAAFEKAFECRPKFLSRAPGRVNLMGGHVDYNEGLVLPVAVDLEVAVAFTPRDDRHVRIYAELFDETAEFDISELTPGSVGGWAAYPAGVAWAIAKADLPLSGLDAAVVGNIPIGGGLSSSAAVEVAFAAAFRQVSGLELPDLKLAQLSQTAENSFVGVRCGIMDQVTAACALPGKALLLDCRTLAIQHVALPSAMRIVVLCTGVQRELRDSEYNDRRRECEEAVSRLSEVDNDIRSLRDVEAEGLLSLLRHLPPPLDRRARHVVGEIERVQLAAAALETGETERFGELMFASHRSLRDDYQVSSEELDGLVELARQAPGSLGARLTGAGFGGCTVNLVTAALVDDFLSYVTESYQRLYGREADQFVTDAARGLTVEKVGW